ncbi:MAG TPA: aspartyl protease family protein [Terracidiphilus sp.]|jgi:hypothetical protein
MSLKRLLCAGFVCIVTPVVYGEFQCPGNAASLPLLLIQGRLFVAPVEVNGTGPYDFLIDTGAQVNSIDDDLTTALHLTPERSVGVNGAATYSLNVLVLADLEAAGKKVAAAETVVVNAEQLRAIDHRIRGILGGTFLEHFDFLLDNQNRILCLDDTGALAAQVKGKQIALENSVSREKISVPFTRPLVVSARLSGIEKPRTLLLDSGSNSPLLLDDAYIQLASSRSNRSLKRFVNGRQQNFMVMPPQQVRIGRTVLRGAEFAVPITSVGGNGPLPQEDGVLPTIAYRRVFISCSKGYVVLDPWD